MWDQRFIRIFNNLKKRIKTQTRSKASCQHPYTILMIDFLSFRDLIDPWDFSEFEEKFERWHREAAVNDAEQRIPDRGSSMSFGRRRNELGEKKRHPRHPRGRRQRPQDPYDETKIPLMGHDRAYVCCRRMMCTQFLFLLSQPDQSNELVANVIEVIRVDLRPSRE